VGVELFEEGDVHLGFPAVVDAREAPAACVKANQLSSWLRLTLGNLDDRFLSAVTVLATHLLTEALRLHIAFPGHRLLLFTPNSLFHNHSLRVRVDFQLLGDECLLPNREVFVPEHT